MEAQFVNKKVFSTIQQENLCREDFTGVIWDCGCFWSGDGVRHCQFHDELPDPNRLVQVDLQDKIVQAAERQVVLAALQADLEFDVTLEDLLKELVVRELVKFIE